MDDSKKDDLQVANTSSNSGQGFSVGGNVGGDIITGRGKKINKEKHIKKTKIIFKNNKITFFIVIGVIAIGAVLALWLVDGDNFPVSDGRFEATILGAPHSFIEVRGSRITVDVLGGFATVTERFTYRNGNLSFPLDGVDVAYRVRVLDDDTFLLIQNLMGIEIEVEYVRTRR